MKVGDKVWFVDADKEIIGSGKISFITETEITIKTVGCYYTVLFDEVFDSEKEANRVLANNLTHKVSQLQKRIRQLESVP